MYQSFIPSPVAPEITTSLVFSGLLLEWPYRGVRSSHRGGPCGHWVWVWVPKGAAQRGGTPTGRVCLIPLGGIPVIPRKSSEIQ